MITALEIGKNSKRLASSMSLIGYSAPSPQNSKEMYWTIRQISAPIVSSENIPREVLQHLRSAMSVIADRWSLTYHEIMIDEQASDIFVRGQDSRSTPTKSDNRAVDRILDQIKRLDSHRKIDAALDLMFDQVDEMLLAGRFDEVDLMLERVVVKDFSVDSLIGFLTVTLPAKKHLSARQALLCRVDQELSLRREQSEELLIGLE